MAAVCSMAWAAGVSALLPNRGRGRGQGEGQGRLRLLLLLLLLLLLQMLQPLQVLGSPRPAWSGTGSAPNASPGPGSEDSGPLVAGRFYPIVPDPGSGCSCKVQPPANFILCFDLMSCVRFPRNVTVPSDTLHVRASQIPELVVGDLQHMAHLRELSLENSHKLHHIEPGVFQGMSNLVNLTISFNPHLTHLDDDTFRGLVNLRELNLVKNGFKALADATRALGRAVVPLLRVLSLSENHVHHVQAHAFLAMNGSSLQDLSLASCEVTHIHPDAFLPLRNMEVLRLGGNNLNVSSLARVIDRVAERGAGVALASLDLHAIGLHGRPPLALLQAIARSNITDLVLRRNEMEKLAPGEFPQMPKLRYLDLSDVDLSEIRPGTFTAQHFPNLQTINLSGNRLPGLMPGFLSRRLMSLDLTGNSGQGYTYFELAPRAFVNMTRLKFLYLSFDRLLRLTNESFVGLENLEVLALKNSSLFKLDPGVFLPLRNLKSLNLERNLFPTYRFLDADIFQGLERLQILLLGGCGMKTLGEDPDVFKHLTSVTHLGLQDNALAVLDNSRVFRPVRSLVWLDLSRNKVGSWRGKRLFSHNPNLRELLLAGNTITFLSAAMIQDLKPVANVDLSDNIFNCGCDFFGPIHVWLRGANDSEHGAITRLFKYRCLSPDEWRDREIAEYMAAMNDRSDCTPSDIALAWLVAVPLVVFLVLVFGAVLLGYRFRHHLRYWGAIGRAAMGRTGRDLTKHTGGELTSYSNFQYDAFVSYSNEDRAFVHLLVSMMEDQEPYFKLCVYERDFSIGMAITEAVLGSVALSKRVLLVVSQSFARSQWCAWEAHIAHHQRLLNNDALLVVKLGPVDEDLLTPTLRFLLKTRIYLEYDSKPDKQTVFWSKLRTALSPPIKAQVGLPDRDRDRPKDRHGQRHESLD